MNKHNIKKYISANCKLFFSTLLCLGNFSLVANEPPKTDASTACGITHDIHFKEVPITEFIRFVGKVTKSNFIFDTRQLQFNVSFSSGKSISSEHLLQALFQLLRVHGFGVMQESGYYVVEKLAENHDADSLNGLIHRTQKEKQLFSVFKLQYHQGSEIQEAIKKIAFDLQAQPGSSSKLLDAIQSMQWVKSTNSLLCSGDEETIERLKTLVASLDIPLRQVLIEILVIETDVRTGLDFGLQWGANAKYKNRFGGGGGNFQSNQGRSSFAHHLQAAGGGPPTGLDQIPLGSGFDLGVIGDIILHKGTTFLTLGALVSALQADRDSTIVLNQKLITQDNKNSKIFVGDNIPFPGSVVQTVGSSQQTTSNIEYRDIGVSLSITPMLGEDDIITLDLSEEISEAVSAPELSRSRGTVNGIRSTKTNMVTHVHVPDKHFLVLSGMVRNTKSLHKEGIPCLGGLPLIGALFSRTEKADEKRNVIIFVRPHIIRSVEDYNKVTQSQVNTFRDQANQPDFDAAIDLIQKEA